MIAAPVQTVLAAAAVPYCLIGAHALAVHGVARYTADIDFLTVRGEVLRADFWPAHLAPEIRIGDDADPLSGLVRFQAPAVDVIVGKGPVMAMAVTTARHADPVGAPVVTARSLALLKLEAGGVQDLSDLQLLLAAQARRGNDLRADLERGDAPLSDWGARSLRRLLARLDEDG